ncbi:hypothetical protein BH23GEM9_BH23GEM9_23510 [soil metagenome]
MMSDPELFDLRGVRLDLSLPVFTPEIKEAVMQGYYETVEADAAARIIEPNQTVLEIGAGCGFLSSYIGRLNRANTLICVEANPDLIPVIRHHHDLNGTTALVYHEMLSAETGAGEFFVHPDFWASAARPSAGAARITVPKARFTERLQQWRPDCLIVDIEGGELDLLRLGLPDCVQSVIVEIHEWVYGVAGVKVVMDLLSAMNFAYVWDASNGHVLSYRRLRGLSPPAIVARHTS